MVVSRLIVDGAEPFHLLWALLYMKQYNTEGVSATLCHCCETTYRDWVWAMILSIAELDVVSL